MTITELAVKLGAELQGPGDAEIRGVAGIREAREGDVTYLSDKKHQGDLTACRASAVIISVDMSRDMRSLNIPALVVKNPRYAFALALGIIYGKPYLPGGISDRAVIGKDVVLGSEPTIHPNAVIADGAKIGNRVTLYPGVYVGGGSVIGDDTVLYSNVSIREGVSLGCRVIIHSGTVIGSDGFGFVTDAGRHHKIPQVGGVIIGDDVEIGANCTIDRATLGNTIINKGTKLDNHGAYRAQCDHRRALPSGRAVRCCRKHHHRQLCRCGWQGRDLRPSDDRGPGDDRRWIRRCP